MDDDVATLNDRWQQMLAGWAIPTELMAQAPESPYFFDPTVFTIAADAAMARTDDTASDAVARAALPTAGTVLDVGVGAGAASLRLRPGHITGVDPSTVLLAAFAERATTLGIAHREVEGTWPDASSGVTSVDVVVCHHVVYNVTDLATFTSQLASHAHRRVVIELTARHPMAWLSPYWTALHGLSQPTTPTAEDAVAVLVALGFDVHQQRSWREIQMIGELGDEQVARIARRLCIGPIVCPNSDDSSTTRPRRINVTSSRSGSIPGHQRNRPSQISQCPACDVSRTLTTSRRTRRSSTSLESIRSRTCSKRHRSLAAGRVAGVETAKRARLTSSRVNPSACSDLVSRIRSIVSTL